MSYNTNNYKSNSSNNGGGSIGSSRFLLSAIYFVLAATTGWALKHHNGGQYALAAYGILFVHSILCFLRYTHPNAGNIQRAIANQSTLYAPQLFVSLIITQLLLIINELGNIWLAGCSVVYASIILTQLCTPRRTFIQQLCIDIAVGWHIGYLAWITINNAECYWTAGLALLIFLNHYILWRLKLHFSISQLEVTTVGLCFTVLFTLNTIDEVIEMFGAIQEDMMRAAIL